MLLRYWGWRNKKRILWFSADICVEVLTYMDFDLFVIQLFEHKPLNTEYDSIFMLERFRSDYWRLVVGSERNNVWLCNLLRMFNVRSHHCGMKRDNVFSCKINKVKLGMSIRCISWPKTNLECSFRYGCIIDRFCLN